MFIQNSWKCKYITNENFIDYFRCLGLGGVCPHLFNVECTTMACKKCGKRTMRTILIGVLYTILLILFVIFYMKDQMTDFTWHRTTMSTRFEVPNEIEFPTMTMCMQPGMKTSVKERYGLRENHYLFQKKFQNTDPTKYPNMLVHQTKHCLKHLKNWATSSM